VPLVYFSTFEEAEAARQDRVSEARKRAEETRNAAWRRQPERELRQRNENVCFSITYDITYDITCRHHCMIS
jgi:hypothetical protein